jgi:hypothetical protein
LVLLADFARRAEQAMLHDARDIVPGVQELVEAHRSGRPTIEEVRALTFSVEVRRYALLLGLRRARAWASVRPRAFEAGFESLRRAYKAIICDCDSDLEGEVDGGSLDVEERNVMSRSAAAHADVVFAVGNPGVKGTHALVRTIGDLLSVGVPAVRVIPVVNRAPRAARARAELAAALGELVSSLGAPGVSGPLFLPDRRIDDCVRDGVRLPTSFVEPVVGAWSACLARNDASERGGMELRRVAPGSLGSWTDDDAEPAAP